MKVQEVMTSNPQACGPDANLATAAMLMWESDCGILPVVVEEGRVVGLITDRDICMAAATKHKDAASITVGDVITGLVFSCAPETDVREALSTMKRERVRRLPVLGPDGTLQGMLSMNDVVLEAAPVKRNSSITYADVVETFKSICGPRKPAVQGQETMQTQVSQSQRAAKA